MRKESGGIVTWRKTSTPRTQAEIEAYADAMADMFCAYLSSHGA